MKSLRVKVAAVIVAAAAALIVAPAAATAADYPPSQFASGPPTATPGQPATFSFNNFQPNESVTITLEGENAAGATLAQVKAVVNTKQLVKNANGSGVVTVTVTLPANASGTYTLTAQGSITPGAPSTTFTVAAAGGLPPTGIDAASMTGVWIGGGALLAAGIAVTSVAMIRRRQAEQA